MRQMFNVQSSADTSAIRTGTYNGREHRIIPLVALVEGVLHSANADHPELALASEFGKQPQSWNGRPVVMNHPKVGGEYVSANSPGVLEEWSYGLLFNTKVEDKKLKTEAWIDVEKVNSSGGEIKDILDSLESGDLIEVSTGLYASVDPQSGLFNNSEYEGIWRSIVSDHLAILSKGTVGACSVEDGCGIPRLNQYRQSSPPECECGGACSTQTQIEDSKMPVNRKELEVQKRSNLIDNLFTNSIPGDIAIDDVRTLLRSSLEERYPDNIYAIHTFTSDKVVFELWDSLDLYALDYSIEGIDKVSLSEDEPTKVNILSRIVAAQDGSDIIQEASNEAPTSEKDETKMSNAPNTPDAASESASQTGNNQVDDSVAVQTAASLNSAPKADLEPSELSEPVVSATPTPTPTPTVEEYLSAAPAEIRDSLEAGMRLHTQKKEALIEGILANERNEFGKEILETFDIEMLSKVSHLAKVPTFQGNEGGSQRTNQDTSSNVVPAPIEAFPRKAING